ncbi:MAG: hypothetical protein JWO03_2601 [Bacteroidetes bacterium]|nr:hypothetical protein [Bacteroidota bacterium]
MELTGRLIQVLEEVGGEGKNGKWSKCDFVIETAADKYPKKVCITAWGDLIGTVKATPLESEIKVSFDISSREYNGKWYTDVKAWKVEGGSGGGSSQPSRNSNNSNNNSGSQERPSTQSEGSGSQERYVSEDDLPF